MQISYHHLKSSCAKSPIPIKIKNNSGFDGVFGTARRVKFPAEYGVLDCSYLWSPALEAEFFLRQIKCMEMVPAKVEK
jgi:hypothetical protein